MHPQTESYWGHVNPIGPRSCYDEGKRCAETLFFDYHRQYQLDIRVARIFNTYGPRMHPNDGRVVSNFIMQALRGEPITVYGEGAQTRSFCYVDDLIDGFLRFMQMDAAGCPARSTWAIRSSSRSRQLAEQVIDLTGSALKHRLQAAARRRSHAAPARHLAGAQQAAMGTHHPAARGTVADHRVLRAPARQGALSRVPGEADPSDVAAAWLQAMRGGDWEAAWCQTDRLELPRRLQQRQGPGFAAQPHHLVWDGTPWADRSVRVRCLHGLGDTLQFMRFVPLLQAHARELHFLVQPMLLQLLSGAPGLGQVSTAWTDDPPPAEVELEIMELAYAVRATTNDVPPPYPHLAAQVATRRIAMLPGRRPRVALFWSGSDYDMSRSPPLAVLAPLLEVAEVQFCSFQQGPAAADPMLDHWNIARLSGHTQEIADLAAALCAMDLVISVDGMPAHLAATLGRPTWIMLKHDADWRWMRERSDSPWYPTARLFRQPAPGDWTSVAATVAQALRDQLESGWLTRST